MYFNFSVEVKNQWFRAVWLSQETYSNMQIVRLVDTGEVLRVNLPSIRICPSEFLVLPSLAFCCHLDGLFFIDSPQSHTVFKDIIKSLPSNKVVYLEMTGRPEEKSYERLNVEFRVFSLPVDVVWRSSFSPDPFLPPEVITHSLMDNCKDKLYALDHSAIFRSGEENCYSDIGENLEAEEFDFVDKMKQSGRFHWPPPELPGNTSFTARGIVVDDSGQIYVQTNSQKKTVKLLKKLLIEKLGSSSPDDDLTLRRGQECCVRWEDGLWYRGRFLDYTDETETEGHFLLVDFGNLCRLRVKEDVRRNIYAETVPIQALRLELAGVTPTGKDMTWSDEYLDLVQSAINFERLGTRHSKLKVQVVGSMDKLPLQANIKFEIKSKEYVDLAEFISFSGHAKLKKNSPSRQFMEIRAKLDFGIEAVPSGTYKTSNFYELLQKSDISDHLTQTSDEIDCLKYLDWVKSGLGPGDVFEVEVIDVVSSTKAYLHPADQKNKYLRHLASEYEAAVLSVQAECRDNPPVFQPREGLLVAAEFEGSWYRAVITGFSDTKTTVRFLDYGNIEVIRDSLRMRELPSKMLEVPIFAVELDIDAQPAEEEDIVHSVMMETIKSFDGRVGLRLKTIERQGRVVGDLVDLESGSVLYRQLAKEGLLLL